MTNQKRTMYLSDYASWKNLARQIGWVHCHDDFIVVDCVDSGVCVGEFSDKSGGWLDTTYVEQYMEKNSVNVTTFKD